MNTSIRLQQILARAGVASRRRAEVLMTEGRVAVNGKLVTTLGARADPVKDIITLDGQPVGPAQPAATLMLHKPVQVMTTLVDPQGRETVADLVKEEPFRFVPVGRLDYQTEGLLLMTTDGELVNRLLHPSYHVPKIYQVKVRGRLRPHTLNALRDGIQLDDGRTRPAVVEILHQGETHTWLELVVTEGRNRLVRRMVETAGHPALRVVRTEMATLELGQLKPAQFRYLGPGELAALYTTAGLATPKFSKEAQQKGTGALGKARRGRGPLPNQEGAAPNVPEKKKSRRNRIPKRDSIDGVKVGATSSNEKGTSSVVTGSKARSEAQSGRGVEGRKVRPRGRSGSERGRGVSPRRASRSSSRGPKRQ